MDVHSNVLQGDVFVRDEDVERVHGVLRELGSQHGMPMGQLVARVDSNPPTHFTTNDFTRSSQAIVDTYGVGSYQEANPAYFTCITFPFMFGVMFGDVGHGTILFIVGLVLVFRKDSLKNTVMKPILPHRYLIALMGFFAMYCGLIYNDTLSMSLNLFGSCHSPVGLNVGEEVERDSEHCVYPFGVDPMWETTHSYLNFMNSLKMKISVIVGVLHMTLGVFMKGSNNLYRRNYIDFFFEFVPQLIFMLVLFGYMDFLIVYKWLQNWDDRPAPSIITTLINIPMKFGATVLSYLFRLTAAAGNPCGECTAKPPKTSSKWSSSSSQPYACP